MYLLTANRGSDSINRKSTLRRLINVYQPSTETNPPEIQQKTVSSDFAAQQCYASCCESVEILRPIL